MKNEKGYAFLIVLLAIILISVIGFGLMTVSSQSIQTSTNEKVDQSLFFVAEAGLNYADEDIQKQIVVAYDDLKKNPPANFNVDFKAKVQTILNQYSEVNKGTKAPSTLLKASVNKKPEIWVGDINSNPADTTKLITFKIYSEGKDINSAKSRKVEREVSIPSELHLVVGNIVSEEDYSQPESNDDKFLEKIDKEEEDKAVIEEENENDPENVPEIPNDNNTGKIYIKNNSDIYLTRHYNLNTKFFVNESDTSKNYKINLLSRKYYNLFKLKHEEYLRSKNSTYIWNKFNYNQKVNHDKKVSEPNLPFIPSYQYITLATGTEKNLTTNVNWEKDNIVYQMPELNPGILTHLFNKSKNYIFNIDVGSKNRTIIFNQSISNYDLTNIAFNVKGTGKLDIIFKKNFIISPNRKFIVKKQEPNSKVQINITSENRLAVMGTLEVDGNVTASRNIKFYYEPSIITGDLHLDSRYSNLTVYTSAKLDVANIYTHTALISKPSVRVFGTLNSDSIYTHDFESHILAKLNTTARKKTIPNDINFDEYVSHKFLPTSELIKATPIIEVK